MKYLIALTPIALGLLLLFAGGAGWVNHWLGVAGLLIVAGGFAWAGRCSDGAAHTDPNTHVHD